VLSNLILEAKCSTRAGTKLAKAQRLETLIAPSIYIIYFSPGLHQAQHPGPLKPQHRIIPGKAKDCQRPAPFTAVAHLDTSRTVADTSAPVSSHSGE
jgi:hypothetical protein